MFLSGNRVEVGRYTRVEVKSAEDRLTGVQATTLCAHRYYPRLGITQQQRDVTQVCDTGVAQTSAVPVSH